MIIAFCFEHTGSSPAVLDKLKHKDPSPLVILQINGSVTYVKNQFKLRIQTRPDGDIYDQNSDF